MAGHRLEDVAGVVLAVLRREPGEVEAERPRLARQAVGAAVDTALEPAGRLEVRPGPLLEIARVPLPAAEEGPNWKNVTVAREIEPSDFRKRKAGARADFTILGSGSIVRQLGSLGLIDEYALVVVPLLLGAGKPLFEDFEPTSLELLESRAFQNGLVLLRYKPL